MPMTYYSYWYRLNDNDAYLIWYTDESADGVKPDGVLLDDVGYLLMFQSIVALQVYADHRGLSVKPEVNPEPLDLDTVQ